MFLLLCFCFLFFCCCCGIFFLFCVVVFVSLLFICYSKEGQGWERKWNDPHHFSYSLPFYMFHKIPFLSVSK